MRLRPGPRQRWAALPRGLRDLAPAEAARHLRVVGRLRATFRAWGYREVLTPALEYLETLVHGGGPGIQDRLFKVVGRRGELLALRPDLTVSIARLAATRLLPDAAGPLRLAYVAPVYREQEEGRGRLREFTQAGVERLGEDGVDADAEVIALAVEALRRAGIARPVVTVGHIGFLDDALGALPPETRDALVARLYRKQFAGIEATVPHRHLGAFLRELPLLQGGDALAAARAVVRTERGEAALAGLEALLGRLEEHGVGEAVAVDLSIIRDFSYYTGVVFEGYGAGSGYPLLGGGRYDGLLAAFGTPAPATGFALGVDRVVALVADGEEELDVLIAWAGPTARASALRLARGLRETGAAVIAEPGRSWEETLDRAGREGARWVMWVDGDGARVRRLRGDGPAVERRVPVAGAADVVAAADAHQVAAGPEVGAWSH